MAEESFLPEDQIPSCVDHGPYDQMPMGVLASLAVGGDAVAFAEFSRRAAQGERSPDVNYELRHPGHGDQSVHNPHKGGAVPAGGGEWTPGGLTLQPKLTKAEWKEKLRKGRDFPPTAKEVDIAYSNHKTIDTYTNGPLTIKVKSNQTPKPTAEQLKVMDETGGDIMRRYPGELTVTWQKNYDDGPYLMGKANMGARTFRLTPRAAQPYEGRSGNDNLKYAMWHESGHAIPIKALKNLGRPDVLGNKTNDAIKAQFDSIMPSVPMLKNRFGDAFTNETDRSVGHSIMRSAISNYGQETYTEAFAEAFAIWHTGAVATKSNKTGVIVINKLAELEGWKP